MRSVRMVVHEEGLGASAASLRGLLEKYGVASVTAMFAAHDLGRIRDFHRSTGASLGPLGPLVGVPTRETDDSILQRTELGEIRLDVRAGTCEAIQTWSALVQIAAVRCFSTEDPGGSDETFVVASVISVNLNRPHNQLVDSVRTEIVENVHGGNTILKSIPIATVDPLTGGGILVHLAVFDHESGDVDELRDKIKAVLNDAAKRGAEAAAAALVADDPTLAGPVGDVTEFEIGGVKPFELLTGGLAGAIADLFADDLIGEHTYRIPYENIKQLMDQNGVLQLHVSPDLDSDVQFNWPRAPADEFLFHGGGGDYKVYLTVIPERRIAACVPALP